MVVAAVVVALIVTNGIVPTTALHTSATAVITLIVTNRVIRTTALHTSPTAVITLIVTNRIVRTAAAVVGATLPVHVLGGVVHAGHGDSTVVVCGLVRGRRECRSRPSRHCQHRRRCDQTSPHDAPPVETRRGSIPAPLPWLTGEPPKPCANAKKGVNKRGQSPFIHNGQEGHLDAYW